MSYQPDTTQSKNEGYGQMPFKLIATAFAVATAILVLELLMPLGVAGDVPYVALVLLGIWFPKPVHVYALAGVASALTLSRYLVSPEGGIHWMVLFAIWITALLTISRKKFENQLRLSRNSLERDAIERTKELRKNDERFKQFAETASDCFWETDAEHRFTWFSVHSLVFNSMLGKTRWETGGTDDDLTDWNALKSAMDSHERFSNIEFSVQKDDDTELYVSANGQPLFDANSQFIGYRGTARDISEQKRSQRERDKEINLRRHLLETTFEGYWNIDLHGMTVDVNPAMCRILGRQRKEIIGKGISDFVDAENAQIFRTEITARKKGKTGAYEIALQRPNGTNIPCLNNATPIFDDNGLRLGSVGMWTDISERVKTRNQLLKLSQTVEQNPNIIFITDTEGTIEYVNSKFHEITGYTAEEAIGQNPRMLQSSDTPITIYKEMWAALKAGETWRGEFRDRCKDGRVFWAEATIVAIRDEGGQITHYFSSHKDITMRKFAEQEMRVARDQAVVANRAKTDLMANMSHELRTPLNAIIGFSCMIKDQMLGPIGNDAYRGYIGDIHHSGEHLLAIVNDILDVSAIEVGEIELNQKNINISNLVDTSIRLIRAKVDKGGVAVFHTINPELPKIYADERRVKQVILNLLNNAAKFTPQGGKITVDAWSKDDGSIAISIADTGIGMNKEEVEIALTRFGQLDSGLDRKVQEGTGLGLPLSQGLMEQHGGTLEIKSHKGHGTMVIVTIPKERVV